MLRVGRGLEFRTRFDSGGEGLDLPPQAQPIRNPLGDLGVDVGELGDHALAHSLGLNLAQLEDKGGDDMVLLGDGLRVEKLTRLRKMISERLRANPQLVALQRWAKLVSPGADPDAEYPAGENWANSSRVLWEQSSAYDRRAASASPDILAHLPGSVENWDHRDG